MEAKGITLLGWRRRSGESKGGLSGIDSCWLNCDSYIALWDAETTHPRNQSGLNCGDIDCFRIARLGLDGAYLSAAALTGSSLSHCAAQGVLDWMTQRMMQYMARI